MQNRMMVLLLGSVFWLCSVAWAQAQNFGGIDGFTIKYPIQTYSEPEQGKRISPTGKRLKKKDIGPITDVIIVAVIGVRGNGYVQLEVKAGDQYWIRRGHVNPRKKAQVDRKISQSNGSIVCPNGQTLVARGRSRERLSGVGRNLGGVSVYCKKL